MLIALSTLPVFGTAWKERKNAFAFFRILKKKVCGTEGIAVSLVQSADRLNLKCTNLYAGKWLFKKFEVQSSILFKLFDHNFGEDRIVQWKGKSKDAKKTRSKKSKHIKKLIVSYLRSIELWFDSVWCIMDLVECLILFLFMKLSIFFAIFSVKTLRKC